MSLVTAALQLFVVLVGIWVGLYALRHLLFSLNRLFAWQRSVPMPPQAQWPSLTVVIPMHNEEKVAQGVLEALLRCDYPQGALELLPVDDHSSDQTAAILASYAKKYPHIHPLYRRGGDRGKPRALNEALALARGEIVLIFDADYLPPPSILKRLCMAFANPKVGAVMGRVIPQNAKQNLLTRLLDLERSGGYQVDQQARFNLGLVVQYGGTVGGFRRQVIEQLGGFDPEILAEDTDLTFRLYAAGWQVVYDNKAECYEEAPETWEVRYRQLRRWARGHTQVLQKRLGAFMRSPHLNWLQKLDGVLLLGVYLVPPLLLLALAAHFALFMLGALPGGLWLAWTLPTVVFGAFGNFAPFFQVGSAAMLDGMRQRVLFLPWLMLGFFFSLFATSHGVWLALADLLARRSPGWEKTQRFR